MDESTYMRPITIGITNGHRPLLVEDRSDDGEVLRRDREVAFEGSSSIEHVHPDPSAHPSQQ